MNVALPLRAAFYYPWFPGHWSEAGITPFTRYHPTLGWYSCDDVPTIQQHIAAMQHGKIRAGISSWWGQAVAGNYLAETDVRVPALLKAAEGTDFNWTLMYEAGAAKKSPIQILMDLNYIKERYASHPNFLHVMDRWVLFVYHTPGGGRRSVDNWIRALDAYSSLYGNDLILVMQVYADWETDPHRNRVWWFQYSGSQPYEHHPPYSTCISPGWWRPDQPAPKLARDLTRWYQNIRSMSSGNSLFQLVCSFNEWGEGSSIEPATEWDDGSPYGTYMEALHRDGN